MTTYTVNPDKLAQLDTIDLHNGSHPSFEKGHCAMEVVAWLADLGHTDAPACASEVLTRATIRLNDRWDHQQRQALKPLLPRMVGTAGDGKDDARVAIAQRMLCTDLLGPWLRLAGMDVRADALSSLVAATPEDLRAALWAMRDEAWKVRNAHRDALAARIREELAKQGKPAVAVAAVAAEAAVAVAEAAEGKDSYWPAYHAASAYFRANPLPVMAKIRDLGAQQAPLALQLLDAMIDPQP